MFFHVPRHPNSLGWAHPGSSQGLTQLKISLATKRLNQTQWGENQTQITEPQICLGWESLLRSSSPTIPSALPRPPMTHVPRCHIHRAVNPCRNSASTTCLGSHCKSWTAQMPNDASSTKLPLRSSTSCPPHSSPFHISFPERLAAPKFKT